MDPNTRSDAAPVEQRDLAPQGRRLAQNSGRWVLGVLVTAIAFLSGGLGGAGKAGVSADTVEEYVALLLVNETPFPGERGWISEEDTKAGMEAILWVLHSRLKEIPPGYSQEQIASERCNDIIDVITAGGEKGQCDGFYRDGSGTPVAVRRVHERVDYLVQCAGRGAPGKFARLLKYADDLAAAYVKDGVAGVDRFANLSRVGNVEVTGRAYSWMTDRDGYNPGGNFVRIPDSDEGALGGNRMFTLRKLK